MADFMSLIASAIGGAIQAKGAKKSAAANQEGQEAAAKYALDESKPWDITGSLGGVQFDSEGKVAGLGLSDELAAQQKGFLTSADANRQYLQGLEGSPEDAAKRFYDQGMALRGPEQEIAREALDAQLANRGMLGSSGGAAQASGLAQAQGNVNLQARQTASDRVQDMIDKYRGRISGDVGGAVELGQQPLQYANLGVDIGGMLSQPAMLGSKYLSGAALTNANMIGGRYGGWGNALQNLNYKPSNTTGTRSLWGKTPAPMTAAAGRTVDKHYSRNMI
tara:strand:+ start:723 stop:1556 length:834 start_codon:yes stop_codon:yes gene_type:complete